MNLKFSKFNILTKNKDVQLLFNTRTLGLIELDDEFAQKFENEDLNFFNNQDAEIKDSLLENGFIIPGNLNEIDLLKGLYWEEKVNSKILHLSIMTTLDCNFRCTYCFEKRRLDKMNSDTQVSIVNYIKNNIDKYDAIHLDWYGGEPLLNIDCIENISKEVIALCEETKKVYMGTITTNGYGLTSNVVDKLVDLKVSSAQITIDGPKEIHDSRRILSNNKGTFDKIINNILYAKEHLNINIRVNVDLESVDKVDDLLIYLKNSEINECPISIKGVVSADANPCQELVLPEREFANKILDKTKLISNLGLKSSSLGIFNYINPKFCIVDTDAQFIISPEGHVYKCGESYDENDIGNIGKLNIKGDMEIDEYRKVFWDKDPFEYKDCKQCRVLPICMGGCQLKRKVKKEDWCNPELKYNLEDLICMYYESVAVEESLN